MTLEKSLGSERAVDSISFEETFIQRFTEKHVVVRGSCKQQMLGKGGEQRLQ